MSDIQEFINYLYENKIISVHIKSGTEFYMKISDFFNSSFTDGSIVYETEEILPNLRTVNYMGISFIFLK